MMKGTLLGMPLNEIGDFLAGVSAPLTLIWLVVGFKLQAQVSARAEKEMVEGARRQEESIKWIRAQAETEISRLNLERERSRAELEPALHLSLGTVLHRSGQEVVQEFVLLNEGASARDLKVILEGIAGVDSSKPHLTRTSLTRGEKCSFSVTAPRGAGAMFGTVRIDYVKPDGTKDTKTIPLAVRPAEGDEPTSMPKFELEGL